MEINLIQWSEALGPSTTCPYNHVQGKTPFGDLLITWKGWKEIPEYELEQAPWNVAEGGGLIEYSLSDIKRAAEQVFQEKLKECLPNSTPYSEVKRPVPSQSSSKITTTMQVSMDGLRRNIAHAYNDFVREVDLAGLTDGGKEKLDELCCSIGGLLCVYNEELENFSDLSQMSKEDSR